KSSAVARSEVAIGELGRNEIVAGDDLAAPEEERCGMWVADVYGVRAGPAHGSPKRDPLPARPPIEVRLGRGGGILIAWAGSEVLGQAVAPRPAKRRQSDDLDVPELLGRQIR